ncbi:MAG: hypothetical protein JW767_04680 [Thermoleophilia bacterium]|nr:hypothetical protein [Thermoleophilia bacterium]
MVDPVEVDHQERDLDLVDRGIPAPVGEAERLGAIRERLGAAHLDETILASDRAPYCRDCFRRGWRAALRQLGPVGDDEGEFLARVHAGAHDGVIFASDRAPHSRTCYRRGWLAALGFLEGC